LLNGTLVGASGPPEATVASAGAPSSGTVIDVNEITGGSMTETVVGPPGPQGPPGPSTSNLLSYRFSTAVVEPPSNSQVRLDNADPTLAVKLWASKSTSDAIDPTLMFTLWCVAGNHVGFQDANDSTKWQRYQIGGPVVDKGTYLEVPVSWLSGGGVLVNNAAMIMVFSGVVAIA
jgi:hypothetical protein